ncbi:MAG: NUDIX hydrolase [Zoogloeaceae bacterium]|jgi:8-oxo-dGTP pyrophosphatase MutT (NUDIX family)|nr:NUDIX hydrolase [Zoogloeaceae bacterium]
MSNHIWHPHVTVAALAFQDNQFLLVEEEIRASIYLNQPAGHLEPGESLIEAVARECLEETGYHFRPTALVGIYQWALPAEDITYLRFSFAGDVLKHEPDRPLDHGIIAPRWLTLEAIRASKERHRSPMVLRCVEDYLAGHRLPLTTITHYA